MSKKKKYFETSKIKKNIPILSSNLFRKLLLKWEAVIILQLLAQMTIQYLKWSSPVQVKRLRYNKMTSNK